MAEGGVGVDIEVVDNETTWTGCRFYDPKVNPSIENWLEKERPFAGVLHKNSVIYLHPKYDVQEFKRNNQTILFRKPRIFDLKAELGNGLMGPGNGMYRELKRMNKK